MRGLREGFRLPELTASSCTTFLKTITNQRGGYMSVDGDVSYGGISAADMAERYRGEVVYNQEDDVHHATLTVAQTILFALNTKVRLFTSLVAGSHQLTPLRRPPASSFLTSREIGRAHV